jgi:predicted oxidoreductase
MRRRVWRQGTISAVGFGAMSFGGVWDTANVYGDGLCEQVIGKFLAEDKSRRARVTARNQVRHSPTRRRCALLRQ